MRFLVHVLALCLLLGQTGAWSWIAAEDACAEGCEDDGEGKECPPVCSTCSCATRPVNLVAGVDAAIAPALPPRTIASFCAADATPPSPEPAEILHVPIALAV